MLFQKQTAMKNTLYFLLLLGLLVSCSNDKKSDDVLLEYQNKMQNSSSFEYDMHYKMKYFSGDDTLDYFTNCRLIRHQADSIFGGSFWIKNDSIDRYYDLEHIYILEHNKKKVTRYFPHKGQDWVVKGNTISGVLNTSFLKTNGLTKYLKDSTVIITQKDTIFNKHNRYAINFQFADELPIEQESKTLYFDPKNTLKNISYAVKFQNDWQYNEWNFSNEKYNQINDDVLKSELKNILKSYSLEDFREKSEEEIKPLSEGLDAPNFMGLNFQTNDSLRLTDLRGKVVVLDFWYKDCFPCIKAISSINRLREKYPKNKLEILGLNPFNNNEKDRKKLPLFIETNKMNYPTIFIDKATQKDYNVMAFPTFYIIDTKGKIAFSKIGYDEKKEHKIDSIIQTMIPEYSF